MADEIKITVPDIGGASQVDVIELLVKPGDIVNVDTPLVTLESDKASMEIPSPFSGTVVTMVMKLGDKVAEGDVILTLLPNADTATESKSAEPEPEVQNTTPAQEEKPVQVEAPAPQTQTEKIDIEPSLTSERVMLAAGPAVRRMARELGVDLTLLMGSGRKSRITKDDVQAYVKNRLAEKPAAAGGFALPQAPVIDFTKFGAVEVKPLNKIKRLTGANVHRSWITIPHVTQFDEADITTLEAFRKSEADAANQAGYKLTILAFVTRAVSAALLKFPQFNASLDASGENLVFKQYVNIGIAVETPDGLVVPVIKQVDSLSVSAIALEMARLSKKARDKTMTPVDMSGGCFTISSLGGIGGTSFTPIVNSPEVAILGLSRSVIKPVYDGKAFEPRLMLPLSLSYDHRVIDGAEAARFTRYIAELLGDIRRMLL